MAERADLLTIRNEILQKDAGKCLFTFMHDYVTDFACNNLDAMEIKGMCRLIQAIKDIPEECNK